MPSSPRHRKEDNSLKAAWIGSVAVILAALIAGSATLLAAYITRSSSANVPEGTQSSRPSTTATASRSALGTGLTPVPAPTGSPSPTSAQSRTATQKTSPPATPTPQPVPISPTPTPTSQPSMSADNSQLGLSIASSIVPILSGLNLTMLDLFWTPTVTSGSQAVTQNCRITWDLYNRTTSIYKATSLCSGTFQLPMLLLVGDYRLVGQVTLDSGQQAQSSVDIPAS